MILPVELFGTLAEILKDDKAALCSLSLTHRSLTSIAQRRLFRHLSIGGEIDDVDSDNSIFHALKVTPHSHILSYIHSITLRNLTVGSSMRTRSSIQYIPNSLAPKLIDTIAPQLTSLSLIGFAPGWEHEDALPLRRSIVRLLSSPHLKHLGLDGVNMFTLGLLNRCRSLKSLRFATPYPSHNPGPSDSDPSSESSPVELEKLDLSFWGELPATSFIKWMLGQATLKSNISVAKLQQLTMNGASTKAVSTTLRSLLAACSTTLKCISLGPEVFEFDPTPTPSLPSLDTINFTWRLTYHPTPVDCTSTNGIPPFPFLVHLLSPSCSFLQNNNSLRCIDIHCRITLRPHATPSPFYRDPVTGEHGVYRTPLPPGAYQIKADFFDPLVDALKEGVRSGRLDKLETVRVGVNVHVYTADNPNPNPNPWVYHDDFVEVYRKRFADFGSLDSDHVQLVFYEFAL